MRSTASLLLAAALLGGLLAALPAGGEEWLDAEPGYEWSWPRDHWSHAGYRSEWWYVTGHLAAESGRRFGYQFTFFRVGLAVEAPDLASRWAARDLIMGHAAVSDIERGEHVFSEVLYRAAPMLGGFGEPPDSLLAWSLAPVGTDATWELRWNGRAFDIDMRDDERGIAMQLTTEPTKPFIFQGPGGLSRKAEDESAASLYYSNTRLATRGTIEIGGAAFDVTGTSWMDKEFGSNKLSDAQVGWDWFSLQLDDGRDLMLYVLRDDDGNIDYASGTVADAAGDVEYLDASDWRLESDGGWRSPESDAVYPMRWKIQIDGQGIAVSVVPEFEAQENCSKLIPGLCYWEGAVRVEDDAGRVIGRGFVELTGYGETGRLAL